MNATTAKKFLNDALMGVESESIRKWANTEKNRPLWEKIAATYGTPTEENKLKLTTYIVATAIGL